MLRLNYNFTAKENNIKMRLKLFKLTPLFEQLIINFYTKKPIVLFLNKVRFFLLNYRSIKLIIVDLIREVEKSFMNRLKTH